jgi:hypothetical protein
MSVHPPLYPRRDVSHRNCQIILLGDADNIIEHLCDKLGWTLPPAKVGQYLSGQFPTLMKRRSQEYISPGPKRVADRYVGPRGRLGCEVNALQPYLAF